MLQYLRRINGYFFITLAAELAFDEWIVTSEFIEKRRNRYETKGKFKQQKKTLERRRSSMVSSLPVSMASSESLHISNSDKALNDTERPIISQLKNDDAPDNSFFVSVKRPSIPYTFEGF